MPKTLLWRLGLALMAFEVVIVATTGVYALNRIRAFHLDQTEQQLSRLTTILSATVSPLVEDNRFDTLQDQVTALAGDADIRITIVRQDGLVLADSDAEPETMENHGNRPEIREAMQAATGASVRFSNTVNHDMCYFARRITGANGEPYILRSSMGLTAIEADFARVGRLMLLIGAGSLGATFLAIFMVSRHLAGQVQQVSAGAARYARGELDHRVGAPPSAELAELAHSLNVMAEELSQRIEALNEQRRNEQAILRSMSSGVVALDLDEHILNINDAAEQMLGLVAATGRGRMLQEVIRQPELHDLARQGLSGANIESTEFTLRTGDGVRVQARCEPLRDANASVRGVLLILDDVTELRRLENIRSDFAANVSHELRTPITNLSGYVETLLEVGLDDIERAQQFLQTIKRNCDRLAAIVEDVLSLTQLEQPQDDLAIEREPIVVDAIVRSVVGQFSSAAAEKHIELHVDVEPNLKAHWRRQLIEQALANLLDNAIKFSPPESKINVDAQFHDDSSIRLSVADEGPGISPEHLPRLFERFYRVDRARSRQLGGTGLGLAIVKHITLVHGGTVDVSSRPGEGATFVLVLPTTRVHSAESKRVLSAP